MTYPRRGDVYLVSFDPTIGHEIRKTRPAVVIQNDFSDQYSPITIVAAVSWHFGDPPESATIAIAAQRPFKCAW